MQELVLSLLREENARAHLGLASQEACKSSSRACFTRCMQELILGLLAAREACKSSSWALFVRSMQELDLGLLREEHAKAEGLGLLGGVCPFMEFFYGEDDVVVNNRSHSEPS